MILFSLILPTLGRYEVLIELFNSLKLQEEKNFEVIVVDQNPDEKIRILCESWGNAFPIKYIHSRKPGLSLNRNIGLSYAKGEIIAFPDDDCKYHPDTLMRVKKSFEANIDVHMIFGQMIDSSSNLKWNYFPENSMYVKKRKLFKLGCSTFVLDGDNVRHGLSSDLGFSDADRKENIRRIGETAKLMLESGTIVLTAFISPFREDRESVRNLMPHGDFIEIYCKTSLEKCEERDVKGLYKLARLGKIKNYTGLGSSYEEPKNSELTIDTGNLSIEESVNRIIQFLDTRSLIDVND